MKPTEDYHKMQKCEYYQSEQCDCLTECVAILKESTPSETESQEDLWVKVMVESEYIESEGIWKVIERLKTQFTITRKP